MASARATRKRKGDGGDEVNELEELLRGLDQLHGDPYRENMPVRRHKHRLLAASIISRIPRRRLPVRGDLIKLRPARARARRRAHPTRSVTHGCWRFPFLRSHPPHPSPRPALLLSASRPSFSFLVRTYSISMVVRVLDFSIF